ncbi:MAG: preprotein translocase subunit SecE [Lachnospiraceae bacterium]
MGETNNNSKDTAVKKSKGWFKGLKTEFGKIIWTRKEDIARQTVSVVAISVVLGIIIAVIDKILQYGIDFLVKL